MVWMKFLHGDRPPVHLQKIKGFRPVPCRDEALGA